MLRIIGVRHHSPACARLVREAIRELRPAYVLVEGPADMNGRLAELLLGHELPVAVFTSAPAEGRSRASWSPLCDYSPEERKVFIEQAHFFSRTRRRVERWQVILLVDQSGSMLNSVIHSAVTAACLWGLPGVQTHLVAFDTAVVDLTRDVDDPVELLMKVQLGGGTDIAQAVRYAASLVDNPRRAIVALVSDLYEGVSPAGLVRGVRELVEQGCRVLALCALDEDANPDYDRQMAQRLANLGAFVGAMTPGELAGFVAEAVGA